ncbi:BlaI/MecI/CopY family transcriptional regulator [Embleya sp. MST-111070]|uniref:BlaI/MecI/CopY family transcriptional regulator n=1 Tax=Embleya sp. MST-111070 TaxID=3398231 RepID=UPI003F732B52
MWGLGSLEGEAMDVVWSMGRPVVVHDVVAALNERREKELAYTTVMTVLNKLVAKGWLERRLSGRVGTYMPVEDKDAYTARIMAETLADSQDRAAALLGFVERLDPVESAALRAALRRVGDSGAVE